MQIAFKAFAWITVIILATLAMTGCAPWEAVKRGRIPESGCVVWPKGHVKGVDGQRDTQIGLNVKCSWGTDP